ncbi:hypothetical protein E4T56_gene16330 [Termitomyces sp. T112]|nr:hypothetical protein E4T56_gene16330 [Termitomyces sp. T112]
MSSVADVSNKLGEYMLKGWVLTDQSCKTPGCSVPLMRSPNGRTPIIHFCANCDAAPGESRQQGIVFISDSTSSATSDSNLSRSSTPPTEVSSALSSPVFAPPADTEESRRRREQSDIASAEISKRLLKGWAMLGDECPSNRCYGVPLVRPPKAGGEKDPRKECVICGGIYLTELDWTGKERLILTNSEISRPDTSGTSTISPLISLEGSRIQNESRPTTPVHQPLVQVPSVISAKTHLQSENSLTLGTPQLQALEDSASTLQSTLHILSTRLRTITDPQAAIDPSSIGATADAISKVTQALSHVRQLQWSEIQAQRL